MTVDGTHVCEPPAPTVPEGWLRAIDEEMVMTHLGVANAEDTYNEAKRKLNQLICWHIQVATDLKVSAVPQSEDNK